jgi:hypothetical protein
MSLAQPFRAARTAHRWCRCLPIVLVLLGPALLGLAVASAARAQGDFPDLDPYTEAEPERMRKLGYRSFGPLDWLDGTTSDQVEEVAGAAEMLWVETEHFQLGSTLGTYRYPDDRIERERFEDSIRSLKNRLGRLKPPKRELDPWLRLHLTAMLLEDLYAGFHETFGVTQADYAEDGPILGQRDKIRVVLTAASSEHSRYVQRYVGRDVPNYHAWMEPSGGRCVAICFEPFQGWWEQVEGGPVDSVFHASLIQFVARQMLLGYRVEGYGAPFWLAIAYGNDCVREFDSRWNAYAGKGEGERLREGAEQWERRVLGLVENDFFISTAELFAVQDASELDARGNIIAWSRFDYLRNGADGDWTGFLNDLALPYPAGAPEVVTAELLERQSRALKRRFGVSPEELDEAWAAWVARVYPRRK